MEQPSIGEIKILNEEEADYLMMMTDKFGIAINRLVEREWDKITMQGSKKASLIMDALLSAAICLHLSFIGENNMDKARAVLVESITFNFNNVMETLRETAH